MDDNFRETRSCIFRPSGFTVKMRRGDMFEFCDPEVSFATHLTWRERLRLARWFFRSALGGDS